MNHFILSKRNVIVMSHIILEESLCRFKVVYCVAIYKCRRIPRRNRKHVQFLPTLYGNSYDNNEVSPI